MNKFIKIYLIQKYFKLINGLEVKNLSKKNIKENDELIKKHNIPIYLYDLHQNSFILKSVKPNY